jgi:hypothetical protein
MRVSLPHGTTKARALEVLKDHSSKLLARFGSEVSDLQEEWRENELAFSFRARGLTVSGMLIVREEQVELEVKLPLLASFLEGQIRDRAVQVMKEIFEPEIHRKEQRS